jgi:Secretion system C-terminal sorting domain
MELRMEHSLNEGAVLGTSGELRIVTISSSEPLVHIYPNPTSEFFNIELKEETVALGDVEITIMDAQGRILASLTVDAASLYQIVNTSNWPTGVYHIQILQHTNSIINGTIEVFR